MTRRAVDVVVAVVLLVLLSPSLLVLSLLVLISMGPPVLFRQTRSGLHGREFEILKFRSMRHERFAGESDLDRTTRVGNLLRRSSLDELPQLWNVLRGDMSVIGPRPTLPEQVRHYSPRQRGRLAVRPGITGLAQVRGRNSLSWPERIEIDLEYVDRRCLRLDLHILALTALRLARPTGVCGPDGTNVGFPSPTAERPDTYPPGPSVELGHPAAVEGSDR